MSEEIAVWDGRFQPLHKGHIEVIKAIISQFQTRMAVMIIQSSEGFHDDYSAEVNKHHLLSRNPLTFWERYNLLKLALFETDIASQVELLGIPRPDLYWDIARAFYPNKRFICLTAKDDYEKKKESFWHGIGEKTRIVAAGDIVQISATGFKKALKENNNWESFLADGTIDYFRQIKGPQRFKQADL